MSLSSPNPLPEELRTSPSPPPRLTDRLLLGITDMHEAAQKRSRRDHDRLSMVFNPHYRPDPKHFAISVEKRVSLALLKLN